MVKVALLIGVSEYEPSLTPLPGATKDVEEMRRVLENPEIGGFDEVKTLLNPELMAMQTEIENTFSSGRKKEDLVLLFFSGHGVKDDRGCLYLATRYTRKNERGELIKGTAVSAKFVHDIMEDCRSKRQVVILDCCFSGAFAEGLLAKDDGSVDVKNQLGGEGRAILTSSTSTQYSFEQKGLELSIYTNYLIEGISTGVADRDKDGAVSVDELHEYVKAKVHEAAPAMKPEFYPVKEGHTIRLAKAPIGDPKLKYRREVERFCLKGEISRPHRMALEEIRKQQKLSWEEADAIEKEVVKPYQEYQQKLKCYEQEFVAAIRQEYPISNVTRNQLKDLHYVLGLQDEDVASIEASCTLPTKDTAPSAVVAKNVTSEPPPVEPPPAAVSVPPNPSANKKVPLLIGGGLAVVVAVFAGFAFTIGLINRPLEQQEKGTQSQQPMLAPENTQDCFVQAGSQKGEEAKVRSRPAGYYNNVIDGAKYGEILPATGKKTLGGWVQVKLSDSRLGWIGPLVIRNKEEIVSCLQKKGLLEVVPDDNEPSPSRLDQLIPTYKQSISIKPFTACPNNTILYLLGETEKHHFAVCGENGVPKYYIGEFKRTGERLEPPVPWSNNGFITGNVLYDPPFFGVTHSSNTTIRVYTNRSLQEYKEYEVIQLYKYPNIPAMDHLSPLESQNINLSGE